MHMASDAPLNDTGGRTPASGQCCFFQAATPMCGISKTSAFSKVCRNWFKFVNCSFCRKKKIYLETKVSLYSLGNLKLEIFLLQLLKDYRCVPPCLVAMKF
jgi:hypothetical protein